MLTWQPGKTLAEMEIDVIKTALQFFQGNKTQTAQALGISIRTIDNKLGKVVEVEEPRKKMRG